MYYYAVFVDKNLIHLGRSYSVALTLALKNKSEVVDVLNIEELAEMFDRLNPELVEVCV